MKNRSLQIRMVDVEPTTPVAVSQNDKEFEAKLAIVDQYLERTISRIGSVVIGYVIMDTFRKVLVAKASK